MPPRKKVKKITFEQIRDDIQNSELNAEEYEQLAELCQEKAAELQENESIASITTIIKKFYEKFENNLKELEEEEYNKDDEEEVSDHNSSVELFARGKNFFENVQAISTEFEKHDLSYDRHEGSLASEANLKLTLEYQGNTVEFHRIVRESGYGGDNGSEIRIKGYNVNKLEKLWNLTDIEEFGEFISECFDTIASDNHAHSLRETDFFSEAR